MGRLLYEACPCGSQLPRLDKVPGRLAELAHGINIYAMDELLLGCKEILSYGASFSQGRLTVALEAASPDGKEACFSLLKEKWPGLPLAIHPANTAQSSWTLKRSVSRPPSFESD
jgi:phenylacetate-coenzyme A ligase PaaK-like adenylate-forming protein